MENRELLALLSVRYEGNWHRIAAALKRKERPESKMIADRYVTVIDDEYPARLKDLRYPPWVLFYRGDLSLLQRRSVTIVGSRKMSAQGKRVTEEIARTLAPACVIVSGLAKGVDAAAHGAALEGGGRTIGVIGSGLRYTYPAVNAGLYRRMEKEDLILSEFPHDTGVRREHFPWRNRILAALSKQVIVTQASVSSGTMHTVNEALALDREIWCVPYPYGDPSGEGCDLLIQQGANILYEKKQLIDFL